MWGSRLAVLSAPLPWRTLIRPGALSGLTFARAQAGGAKSTRLISDGATLEEVEADRTRFHSTAQRLLIGGQRTNGISHTRTPGGTGWTNTGVASVTQISGPDNVNGSAVTLTEDGGTSAHQISVSTSFTENSVHTLSAIVRPGTCSTVQISGSGTAFGATRFANFYLSGDGAVGTRGGSATRSAIRKLGDSGWYWVEVTWTTGGTATATSVISLTESASASVRPSYAGTGRTIDVFWVWGELGALFASTPILPPSGTPGASTRGADLVSATLSSLGIGGNGACTVLGVFMIPQAAGASTRQGIVAIDEPSIQHRVHLRNALSSTNIELVCVSAGGGAGPQTVGSFTAGTPFAAGFTFVSSTRAAACVNGGAVTAVTSGVPSMALTTALRVGNGGDATTPMFGEVGHLRVLPFALPDATLRALTAALPLT